MIKMYIGTFEGDPVDSLRPRQGDGIVHSFNRDSDLERSRLVHSDLVQAFPENTVVSVPDSDAVDLLDRQSTIEFLQAMLSSLQSKEFM